MEKSNGGNTVRVPYPPRPCLKHGRRGLSPHPPIKNKGR